MEPKDDIIKILEILLIGVLFIAFIKVNACMIELVSDRSHKTCIGGLK